MFLSFVNLVHTWVAAMIAAIITGSAIASPRCEWVQSEAKMTILKVADRFLWDIPAPATSDISSIKIAFEIWTLSHLTFF